MIFRPLVEPLSNTAHAPAHPLPEESTSYVQVLWIASADSSLELFGEPSN